MGAVALMAMDRNDRPRRGCCRPVSWAGAKNLRHAEKDCEQGGGHQIHTHSIYPLGVTIKVTRKEPVDLFPFASQTHCLTQDVRLALTW